MIHESTELVKPSGRYVQLPDCILKDMDNDGADGLVTVGIYISIANAAFNHMVNKITAETIGKNVHRSERTAQRHIKRLVERGRIEIVEANGKVLTIKDLAGMEIDTVRTAKKSDTHVAEYAAGVADTHVASPVATPMSQAHDTHVAENPLVVEHEKSAPPSLSITSYMHEGMSANMQIEQDGMSANMHEEQIMHEEQLAIKQLSMPASNSEDMNSCNSRQEEEVSEKLEEEDSFKNFGRQDGMRDSLTRVSMNHIPKFHILTSVEQVEQDGKGLRESISSRPNLNHSSYSSIPPDSSLRSSSGSCCFCKNHRKPKEVLDENKNKRFGIYGELGLRALCHFLAEDISFSPSGLDVEKHHAQAENFLSQVQTRLSLDSWYSMTLPEFNRARGIWGESDPDPTSDLSELDKYVSMIHVHDEPDLDLSDSSTNTPELVGSK
jgi:hypothetical protein